MGLRQSTLALVRVERPSPSRRGTALSAPEQSTPGEEQVVRLGGGALTNKGPRLKEARKKGPGRKDPWIERPWRQESCYRPPARPLEKPQATAKQQTKMSQGQHTLALRQLIDIITGKQLGIVAACSTIGQSR